MAISSILAEIKKKNGIGEQKRNLHQIFLQMTKNMEIRDRLTIGKIWYQLTDILGNILGLIGNIYNILGNYWYQWISVSMQKIGICNVEMWSFRRFGNVPVKETK